MIELIKNIEYNIQKQRDNIKNAIRIQSIPLITESSRADWKMDPMEKTINSWIKITKNFLKDN